MVEFSCLISFYDCIFDHIFDNKCNSNEQLGYKLFFKFFKYENFMKIKYKNKSIIIRIDNLKNHQLLFQYYIASLLCSMEHKEINRDNNYSVFSVSSTINNWKMHYLNFYSIRTNELFNQIFYSQEPKRETSIKKQKKFIKLLNNNIQKGFGFTEHPLIIIKNLTELHLKFIEELANQIITYENKIYFLSCVRSLNRDIYSTFKEIFDNDENQ
jgi:hypothetical protein